MARQCRKTEEDQKFLESTKTERVATFGRFDTKLSQQAQRKENRFQNQERLREKDGDFQKKKLTTKVELERSTDEDDSDPLDVSPKDSRQHKRNITVSLHPSRHFTIKKTGFHCCKN